jgi:hypothetical protein
VKALAAALAATVLAAGAAVAHSAVSGRSGLRDARYCEILELRGAVPKAQVTVWNTIGLNACPPAQWKALDAGKLASERGDVAVILNGPRHFVMDAASGETGAVHSFGGLRMRKVASIAIRTAAELEQSLYTDRRITRRNRWVWRKGRTVYELVAPGGDVYVMQSYAQIKDPGLRLSALSSLARRLSLPPGWRYRTRRLGRDLVLDAAGGATIVQDDLLDTYQLASTTRRGPRRARAVSVTGNTRTVKSPAPSTVEDRGTVRGTPFGSGTVVLTGKFADGRLTGRFRLTFPRGSVLGTVSMPFTIAGDEITFDGTGRFIGGTGAFRGITSGELHVHDHNRLDGQSGTLSVSGRATY